MNISTTGKKALKNAGFQKFLITFLKFGIVGASNTLVDFAAYLVLTRIFSLYYLYSHIAAFTLASINSFILNKKWTFSNKSKINSKQILGFIILQLSGLALSAFIIYSCVNVLTVNDVAAKIIASGTVMIWNYTISKLFIFKN